MASIGGDSAGERAHGALRQRMIQASLVILGAGLVLLAVFWVVGAGFADERGWRVAPAWARAVLDVAWIGVVLGLAGAALAPAMDRRRLMLCTVAVVSGVGVLEASRRGLGADFGGLGSAALFALAHVVCALMLPWRPKHALLPAAVWVMASALVTLVEEPMRLMGVGSTLALTMAAGGPGVVISAIRDVGSTERAAAIGAAHQFQEVNKDLLDARRIHEGAFPDAVRDGSLQFTYEYHPMSQIGGDYLHAHRGGGASSAEPALSLALLDVTGHGIAAALTVNRLHGELTRLYAENPDLRPIDVLRALNKYVYLTVSGHSVFVTAFIMRADPSDNVLEYASAGHPPAFLRGSTGVIEELGSTAMVLGALPDEDYIIDEGVHSLGPGDSIVAYTDGAIEVRGESGEMLGIEGLKRVYQSGWADAGGRWPAAMVHAVNRYRAGPADDDTLIVELFRTLGGGVLGGRG